VFLEGADIMSIEQLEELDLMSAIWILASKDENHLITYEGIRDRLGLPAGYDVRGLVLKRRELFRPGAPPRELDEWKTDMRHGSRLPTWIKNIQNADEKNRTIDNLADDDIFRSQFRTVAHAPPSDISVVSWGLDHLDRIRKGKIASLEATAKSWQMWLLFWVSIANIVVSIVLAVSKGA
jgi:hypothetical protein